MSYYRRIHGYLCLLASILMLFFGKSHLSQATEASDPVSAGPYEIASSEYHLPPGKDRFVDRDTVTELWARVYRPRYMYIKPYPVILLLHGNHGTCGRTVQGIPGRFDDNVQYSTTGTCPPGFKVVRSHEGLGYAAEKLASWGYVVVSINANRGVNGADGANDDLFLNMRRGRLVLRHLMLLEQWNHLGGAPASLGFDLKGTLDFSQVGLMGHSRGGEGVLAAYNLYNGLDSPWPYRFYKQPVFRGIFAIAPVTNQTSQRLYADDVPWAAVLPLCDGDVYTMDALQVFNRTIRDRFEEKPAMKAVLGVWGANHNFYNTEWQQTDSAYCTGNGNTSLFSLDDTGSAAQRNTAIYAILGFFRAHLGYEADKSFAGLFNPSFSIPRKMAEITRFERVFSESASAANISIVDDFTSPTGFSWQFLPNTWKFVQTRHQNIVDHQDSIRVNAISWARKDGTNPKSYFFQSNGWTLGNGHPLGTLKNLEFRISLACQEALLPALVATPDTSTADDSTAICNRPFPVNAKGKINFSIALVQNNGQLSQAVPLINYTSTHNPVGGKSAFFSLYPPIEDFSVLAIHPLLQTVHIPLSDFKVPDGTRVTGVRFIFDQTSKGSVYLANVRFSRPLPARAPLTSRRTVTPETALATNKTSTSVHDSPAKRSAMQIGGIISAIRAASNTMFDITLVARHPIPVRDSLLMLRIGNRQFMLSRFGANGNTSQVIFTLTKEEYDALPEGAEVELVNGPQRLSFGHLRKSQ